MNYRCPKCSERLKVRNLFFHDIATCSHCGQKVVLGDFLAFFMAALTMSVTAITTLYVLSHEIDQYLVAAGYAVSLGMLGGLVVLFLLGRAKPFKRIRILRRRSEPTGPAPLADAHAEPAPKT
jgi:DNA-directed RNA polymerase subunit RPC12/RpoP